MHRSQTSLVAKVIGESGLFLGTSLIPGNEYNPSGHFEDSNLVNFHIDLMNNRNLTHRVQQYNFTPKQNDSWTPSELNQAQIILKEHFDVDQFGWKDPRAVFFLDGWQHLIPNSFFLFTYRHPAAVVNSLLRRSLSQRIIKFRPDLIWRLLNHWKNANTRILNHLVTFPERCILLHCHDDLIDPNTPDRIHTKISNMWGIKISKPDLITSYEPALNHSGKRNIWIDQILKMRPDVLNLFKALDEHRI